MKMVGCASFLSWLAPEKCTRMLDANVYVAPYMLNTLHFHKIYLLRVHFWYWKPFTTFIRIDPLNRTGSNSDIL